MAQLQTQIDSLKIEVENLKRANGIPRPVETAFRDRLGSINPKNNVGTVATTAIGGAVAFNLPNTTGTIDIVSNGKVYKVLVNNVLS